MEKHRYGPIEWLSFESLSSFPSLTHRIFLNGLDFRAERALEEALSCLHFKEAQCLNQVHGAEIVKVERVGAPPQADGLCTQVRGLPLLIRHADCQAAFFYDPVTEAIGAVHCGWRGHVANIYGACVQAMEAHFGSSPTDLRVAISPSLGPTRAEFKNYQTEFPPAFWPFQVRPTYFDLWALARWQLMEAGILPEHIEIASLCTYTHEEHFFSYRRQGPNRGSHGSLIALL